jgi:chromosome segregation ATPase
MRKLALLAVLALVLPLFAGNRPLSYVWVRGDGHSISTSNMDLDTALAIRDRLGSELIWFRLRGAEYVVRDQATLAALDRLWEPMRASDPEYDALQKRLRALEKKEQEIDRQHDALEDQEERADQARLRELEDRLRDIERQLRPLEREERRLDDKRDAIERDVERKMVPLLEEAVRKGVAKRM